METERVHNLIEQGDSVQRTCLMAEDCSKTPLAVDRNLTMPLKKRKQHEKLVSCDLSIEQNPQISHAGEVNVTSCQTREKEHLCGSTLSKSEKDHKESKIEFSLQSSVFVKADDSTEWIRLKCFDSIIVDESSSAIFFAGGPIQSSAFSIIPCGTKINQYVAIAASNVLYKNRSYNDTSSKCGIIQFWNLGSLYERKILKQPPWMELALYHDNGILTQMKWCPGDSFKSLSTCHLPSLGLLAASSSDSSVYIYNVPQPDFMPKLKSTFPIYFTIPFIKLVPLFGGPSSTTRKSIATCIEWDKNGEHLVAGYGNGSVCVWRINSSSLSSRMSTKNTKQSYIIQPYLFFQASAAPVESLSFAPVGNCHRWLVVSGMDRVLRFFDLEDTSVPFHVVKQGLENSCIWADAFCGVYSTPTLNNAGRLSLSAYDCCAKANDKAIQKGVSGLYDTSTQVAVSEDKLFHAIADVTGTVTVNFLQDIEKPLETSYLTYIIFETEILALDSIADLESEISKSKINITGNIQSGEITPVNDMKWNFYSEINRDSSSSSSSGICSPKHSKIIVIEKPLCFEDDAVTVPKCIPGSSTMNDINNNRIEAISNKLNLKEETNDKMIKYSDFSEDLMYHLLMKKVSNQSKSSSHIFPINCSNNSAYCDSNGAKHLSDRASTSSVYTGDTIVYPLEEYFCDTSHQNAINSVKSNAQSKSLDLNEKGNNAMQKMDEKLKLNAELVSENTSKFSCSMAKSENSHFSDNSSLKNWCEPNFESHKLNYKIKNLGGKCYTNHDLFRSNDCYLTSKHSEIPGEKYCDSNQLTKENMQRGTSFQNPKAKDTFISKMDNVQPSLQKIFNDPLSDLLESKKFNQLKLSPDVCLSTTRNDLIICDKDDEQLSVRTSKQSSGASDCSDNTIIYSLQSYDCIKTGANNPTMVSHSAISQSLCKGKKENTFQDTLFHNGDERSLYGTKTKLTKRCFSSHSGYETDLAHGSCNSSDKNKSFHQNKFLISEFLPLHSEYLCDKNKERHTSSNTLPKSQKYLQELSYADLVGSFGVAFKNNLDKTISETLSQRNDIYVKHNPLSVIKTVSWNPNEGCGSWLLVGGNSGVGRLVYVPDFISGEEIEPTHKKNLKMS